MVYTPMTKKAMRVCFKAHDGQYDKSGVPYANHPLHLAEQMRTEDETCVALLHDVLEDTEVTEADLRAMGFNDAVLEAVCLLTREDGVAYLDYVRALKHNPLARVVKLADLEHNCDLTRLDEVGPADLRRVERYAAARSILDDRGSDAS